VDSRIGQIGNRGAALAGTGLGEPTLRPWHAVIDIQHHQGADRLTGAEQTVKGRAGGIA